MPDNIRLNDEEEAALDNVWNAISGLTPPKSNSAGPPPASNASTSGEGSNEGTADKSTS